jgi:hypothetical protein
MVADKILQALNSRSPQTIVGNHFKPAAVLIPIQEGEDGDYLVLTQRADHLNHHSGQIAFPGGRVDDSDADEMDALRESQVRDRHSSARRAYFGRLDQIDAAYGYRVTPFVGVIPAQYDFRLNPAETAAVSSG